MKCSFYSVKRAENIFTVNKQGPTLLRSYLASIFFQRTVKKIVFFNIKLYVNREIKITIGK